MEERAGGRAVWFVVLALVVLLAGGWAGAYAAAGDELPRGTTVAGVHVGGRTPEAAQRLLQQRLAARAAESIAVVANGRRVMVSPAQAGLSVDYQGSVEAAGGGRSWDPRRLWEHFTGGEDLEAVVAVDEPAMAEAVERLEAGLGREARDGDIVFRDGRPHVVEPVTGEGLDTEATRAALVDAYLDTDPEVSVDLVASPPEIDDADVSRALRQFANPAVSAPVVLVFGRSPVTLRPRDYAAALGVRAEDGRLVPDLDLRRLTRLLDEATTDQAPVDATVRLVGGKPKVVPAKPGVSYHRDDVAEAFMGAVTERGSRRTAKVDARVRNADFSTADARKLRIKEKVSTFTTYFPYAEYRNTNIGRAAELVDGTVLKPGETFSLNGTVGERTRENGFTTGFVISDGIYEEDLGGGVSQLATTLFNAMFFAGLEDVEHKPHSFYIDRYPVGREATVAWGSVDLRFRNDTPYGVLIDTSVTPSTPSSQGSVTVTMWSTKHWDITTRTSGRYAFVPPGRRVLRTRDCYPTEGYAGFQVDVWRYFHQPGEDAVVRSEKFHTSYIPLDTVVCK